VEIVRLTQSAKDEASMRRRMEKQAQHRSSLSQVLRAGGILADQQGLSGNQHGKDSSSIIRFSNGAELTPVEVEALKDFLGLPRTASQEDVESVAVMYSAAHRAQEKEAKAQAPVVRKKLTVLSFFNRGPSQEPGTPPALITPRKKRKPAPGHEDCLLSPPICHLCSGVQMKRTTVVRKSAARKLGASSLKKLAEIHKWRTQNNNATKANCALEMMVQECQKDPPPTKTEERIVTRDAKKMEDILCSGNLVWMQKVLIRFNSRASCREIRNSAPVLFEKAAAKTQTKEEEVYGMFVQQLRGFVTILTESKGGSRTKEDQNAIGVVLAALIHPSVFGKSLGRTVQRMLGVSWKAIVRAVKARKEFEKVPPLPPSETS
jgi:hypothetical protein